MIPAFDELACIYENNPCVYCKRHHDHFFLEREETLEQMILIFCPDCGGVTVRESRGKYRFPNRHDWEWIKDYPNIDELREYQEHICLELGFWG